MPYVYQSFPKLNESSELEHDDPRWWPARQLENNVSDLEAEGLSRDQALSILRKKYLLVELERISFNEETLRSFLKDIIEGL